MRKAPVWVLVVIVIAIVGVMLHRQRSKTPQPVAETPTAVAATAKTVVPVSVATVSPKDLVEQIEVTGTLHPADEMSIGARFAGRIAWTIGKEGTAVKRGQLVVRMEDMDAQNQVRAANAAVKAAQARLMQSKAAALQQVTATDSGISNAQAAVEAANARLKQAKTTADAQDSTTKAQIKAAEAVLDSAKSRLDMLKNGARTQERAIAENAVAQAKANYDNDQTNANRYKMLYDQGAVAKSLLESAETKMKVSKAALDSAQQQLSLVQVGARAEDIQAAEAAVRQSKENLEVARSGLKQVDVARDNVGIAETGVSQAKAALNAAVAGKQVNVMRDSDVLAAQAAVQQANEALVTAKLALQYTNVYSPVDGVVTSQLVEVGQAIAANAAVLRVATNNSLYFEAAVSELQAPRLFFGQKVLISVDAMQGNRADIYAQTPHSAIYGTVEKVVPVVDAKTRNFTVRVLVPRSHELFPGMFARGNVIVARHAHVLTVSKDTLVEKDNRTVVYVADGHHTAEERTVVPGYSDGVAVEIKSGLTAGEHVITVGQQNVKDGDPIIIVQPGK